MSALRAGETGATRTCPHCRETILANSEVCPACKHRLRWGSPGGGRASQPTATPLRVEGSVRNPAGGGAWEYSVLLTICNDRGEEVARRLVGVGAVQPNEKRSFTVSVEVRKADGKRAH